MAKSNKGFVEYCKAQLGRPYWFGTFGQIANEKLLKDKAAQYQRQYSALRQRKAAERGDFGKKVHDCYGLYKGYMLSDSPDAPANYDKKYDISADAAFNKATEKGDISTLPEIEGVGLWKKGHFGVYIGNGKEIEARGFDYGVVEDDVKNTAFTHWFKLSDIVYEGNEDPKPVQDAAEDKQNAPATPATGSDDELSYIVVNVVKNDTLSRIAARYGVTVNDLCKWNSIKDPNVIYEGQKIIVKQAPESAELKDQPEAKDAIVNTNSFPLNIRAGSSLNSAILGTLPKGSKIKIAYETGGFAKLYGQQGFVSLKFVKYI